MRCYLVHAEDGLQESRSPVGNDKEAKIIKQVRACHMVQCARKFQDEESIRAYISTADRLVRADEVKLIY